jgi:hypothetical protein
MGVERPLARRHMPYKLLGSIHPRRRRASRVRITAMRITTQLGSGTAVWAPPAYVARYPTAPRVMFVAYEKAE